VRNQWLWRKAHTASKIMPTLTRGTIIRTMTMPDMYTARTASTIMLITTTPGMIIQTMTMPDMHTARTASMIMLTTTTPGMIIQAMTMPRQMALRTKRRQRGSILVFALPEWIAPAVRQKSTPQCDGCRTSPT
jgi:hypothetical protein